MAVWLLSYSYSYFLPMWESHSLPVRYKYKFGRNRAVTKGTLLLRPKQFFVPISPRIETRWLQHHIWHYILMRHKQYKFGRTRAVMKGSLLSRPNQFFVPISPRIAAGWLKRHTSHSLPMLHNQWKFGGNRAIANNTLLWRPKQFFASISPRIAGGWHKHQTWHWLPPYAPQPLKVCSKSGSNAPWGRKSFFIPISPRIAAVKPKHHSLHSLQIVYKPWKFGRNVSNEGHFTREAEIVFRPCLALGWNGVTINNMVCVCVYKHTQIYIYIYIYIYCILPCFKILCW
jgi:hypothetical protein